MSQQPTERNRKIIRASGILMAMASTVSLILAIMRLTVVDTTIEVTLAWISIVCALILLGVGLYFIFGKNRGAKPR